MQSAEYKNRKLEFEESATPKLKIDGHPVDVGRDPDAREYFATQLPYRTFGSLKQLAEAAVDQGLDKK